jgi:CelD/BcsL family acetyltransferase involved in cellulose biosynthesis
VSTVLAAHGVRARLLDGFGDETLGPDAWARLVGQTDVRHVFLTWQWLSSWWSAFPRERLLLVAAERDGAVIAVAPLFADEDGMIYFVGSGGSDYLDFVGDLSNPSVVDLLLDTARRAVPRFHGFRFYHVLSGSPTAVRLQQSAERLGLVCREEGAWRAPVLEFAASSDHGRSAAGKKTLVRRERGLARDGELHVEHWRDGDAIAPLLDEFFAQHVERWAVTPHPSLFCKPSRREFYRRLTTSASAAGWLRFTRIRWRDRAIAFHFGFCYEGRYLWYKPTFAIDLARRSPGMVLLRQAILAAVDEGASTFDFGLGDEPYKSRFATGGEQVQTWTLFPV